MTAAVESEDFLSKRKMYPFSISLLKQRQQDSCFPSHLPRVLTQAFIPDVLLLFFLLPFLLFHPPSLSSITHSLPSTTGLGLKSVPNGCRRHLLVGYLGPVKGQDGGASGPSSPGGFSSPSHWSGWPRAGQAPQPPLRLQGSQHTVRETRACSDPRGDLVVCS